jgi:hypothetical protein
MLIVFKGPAIRVRRAIVMAQNTLDFSNAPIGIGGITARNLTFTG